MPVAGRFCAAEIAPFFVKKKNLKIRLVLDCRGCNEHFHKPKQVKLGSAFSCAWASTKSNPVFGLGLAAGCVS